MTQNSLLQLQKCVSELIQQQAEASELSSLILSSANDPLPPLYQQETSSQSQVPTFQSTPLAPPPTHCGPQPNMRGICGKRLRANSAPPTTDYIDMLESLKRDPSAGYVGSLLSADQPPGDEVFSPPSQCTVLPDGDGMPSQPSQGMDQSSGGGHNPSYRRQA